MKLGKNIFSNTMRYHSLITLAVIVFVLFGIYGLFKMNKQEFPVFTIRQGVIVGVYPGATPNEVLEQLTKPLEEYLFTFQEINKQETYSYSRDGLVFVFVKLNNSVKNQTETWSKIRHGLKDFKAMLPTGVLALIVNDDFGNTTSLLITIESADKTYRELDTYVSKLTDQLRTIDAIGNIKVHGKQNEEIHIHVEPEKIAAYGISRETLLLNLFTQGAQMASGAITNEDISLPIHITSPYRSEEELSEQIILSEPGGKVVRLKDVATVKRSYPLDASYIRSNGNKTLVVSIEMRPGNNVVEFGREVDEILNNFKNTIPQSIKIERITDQPEIVGSSVRSFLTDLGVAILIVIVVMLMLFPLRSALVAATSIPVSIAITLAFMYLFGIELNTVTLAVLIVVLGMVVDNSIVVIDGYIDNLNRGHSRWYSSVESARTYAPSLTMATIAICALFFPILGIFTGEMSDFVKSFPPTMTIALMASLLLALFVIPYYQFLFIKKPSETDKVGLIARLQNKFFHHLQIGYEKLLTSCFKKPRTTIFVALMSIGVAVFLLMITPVQMMPKADRDNFAVEIFLPEGTALEQTAMLSDSLRKIIEKEEDVVSVTEFIGTSSPRFHMTYAPKLPGSNYAQFIVKTKSDEATISLLKKLEPMYSNYFPNAYVRFKQMDFQAVSNPIEIRISGDDVSKLLEQAQKVETILHDFDDDLTWIHNDFNGTMPFVKIELLPEEAMRLGITKSYLSTSLAINFHGLPLTTIWEEDYPVAVKLIRNLDNNWADFEDLKNEIVPTVIPGTWVPLRQVAKIAPDWQISQLVRRNGVYCITVSADMKFDKKESVVIKKIKKRVKNEILPEMPSNLKLEYGGLSEVNKNTVPEVITCIVAALVVIFTFLLMTFKHVSISVLSLSANALCMFGVFVGLYLFKQDLSLTSVLGIVNLIGIMVRNVIIMYEYAEEQRTVHKLSAYQAGLEAGKRRMRPIFLTSMTTAVGVIPMILSKSTLWMPMGIVIFVGTIFSLIAVITVLPVMYWLVFNKKSPVKASK